VCHFSLTNIDEPIATTESLCRQSYRDVLWVNYVVEAHITERIYELKARSMQINQIRGPLPSTRDMSQSRTNMDFNASNDIDDTPVIYTDRIVWIDSNKVVLEDGGLFNLMETEVNLKQEPARNYTPIRKFDRHLKLSRRSSQKKYSVLPSI